MLIPHLPRSKEPLRCNMLHPKPDLWISLELLDLRSKPINKWKQETHAGWWFQPHWQKNSQLGWLLPIYENMKVMFQSPPTSMAVKHPHHLRGFPIHQLLACRARSPHRSWHCCRRRETASPGRPRPPLSGWRSHSWAEIPQLLVLNQVNLGGTSDCVKLKF